MHPVDFPQANKLFGPPKGMDESQVHTIPAYHAEITEGNCDGAEVVVTAWKPSPSDLERLNRGGLVYMSCIGGLPPHFLSTEFHVASNVS